jgi:hypothetical protein
MEQKQITPYMLKELERLLQTPGIKIERKLGRPNSFNMEYTVVDDMGQELLYFKRRYNVRYVPIYAQDDVEFEFLYNIKFKGTEIVKDVMYTKETEQFSNPRMPLYNKIFSLLNEKYTNAEKVACGQDRITFFDKIRQVFKCKVK